MASLRKKGRSPFYFACFTGPNGERVQRSTKQIKRATAQSVANEFEKAARLAGLKRLGEAQARRVIADIYDVINPEPLRSAIASDYLTQWAEKRKADTAVRTQAAYNQVVRISSNHSASAPRSTSRRLPNRTSLSFATRC